MLSVKSYCLFCTALAAYFIFVLSNLPVVLLIAKEGANISCFVAALFEFSLNSVILSQD
jgi:hypothetical protein